MSVCQLGPEEEHILTSFTRRLIKIAADAGAHGGTSTVDVLNTMLFPRSHSSGADLSPT